MKNEKPSKLNAVIYNKFVKVFNDAANSAESYDIRKQIVEARKRFPTYHELLAMDLMYVSSPKFVNRDGKIQQCKVWIGNQNDSDIDASFENVEYLYSVGLSISTNGVIFKLRGTHKGDI